MRSSRTAKTGNGAATLRSAGTASLLDLDPAIGGGVPAAEWEQARRATAVNLVTAPLGEWSPPEQPASGHSIPGLLVIDGLLCRDLALGNHHMLELLGEGDVLVLPAAADGRALGGNVKLTILSPSRLIILGGSFVRAAGRWPSLLSNLHRRLESQRQRLAVQGLTAHLPRAEDRLLLTLRLLADGCGRVTPDGTILPLALSHEVLAKLAAARRPTITLALHALEQEGYVRRHDDGHLTLTLLAQQRISELTKTNDGNPGIGSRITLRSLPQPAGPPPVLVQRAAAAG